MAAQTSVGLVLGAVVWARRLRPWPSTVLLLAAIALAVALPVEADFLRGMGATLGPDHAKNVLKIAAGLATVAAITTGQRSFAIAAVLGEIALWPITNYHRGLRYWSWRPLTSPSSACSSACIGESPPRASRPTTRRASRLRLECFGRDDARRLRGRHLSGVPRLLARPPRRDQQRGRVGEYLPGGALREAPRLRERPALLRGVPQLLGIPVPGALVRPVHAGMAVLHDALRRTPRAVARGPGVAWPARRGRRAAGPPRGAAGFSPGSPAPSSAHVRAAGWFSAMAVVLSSTLLINGASRYPHVFVAALFAWSLEAACVVATGERDSSLSARDQRTWGAILGAGTVAHARDAAWRTEPPSASGCSSTSSSGRRAARRLAGGGRRGRRRRTSSAACRSSSSGCSSACGSVPAIR